jgi:hypothetical protein
MIPLTDTSALSGMRTGAASRARHVWSVGSAIKERAGLHMSEAPLAVSLRPTGRYGVPVNNLAPSPVPSTVTYPTTSVVWLVSSSADVSSSIRTWTLPRASAA